MIPRLRFRSKSIRRTTRRFGSFVVRGRLSGIARGALSTAAAAGGAAIQHAPGKRVSERTRIARELHDTLLQSFTV